MRNGNITLSLFTYVRFSNGANSWPSDVAVESNVTCAANSKPTIDKNRMNTILFITCILVTKDSILTSIAQSKSELVKGIFGIVRHIFFLISNSFHRRWQFERKFSFRSGRSEN